MIRSAARALAILAALTLGGLAPAAPAGADQAPVLTLSPIQLGNVFDTGQPVRVGLHTDAATVSWTAQDLAGTVVASGSQAASTTLAVSVTAPSWYRLTVRATQGTATSTTETTFGIVSPLGAAPSGGLLTTTLGDFESAAEGWTFYPGSEYPGATGSFTRDTSTAHTGPTSGRLAGDFSGGGAYVSVKRALPAVTASSLGLWVRTTGSLSWLTVRLTDATGQVHQQRVVLAATTDWQPLAITRFDGGRQYLHFGGADDGVWHGPAAGLELVLDKGGITGGATSAAVNVDDVTTGYPAAEPGRVLGDFDSLAEGWSFYPGSEYPGATGSLALDTGTPHAGAASARLTGDFSGGGTYVAVQRSLTAVNLTGLSLWARTSQLSALELRVTDSTGQVHQQRLPLSGSTGWQQLRVTRFDGGAGYLHFGGADDGTWHGPATALSLIIDRSLILGGATSASVNLDGVTAAEPASALGAGTHFGQAWSPDVLPLFARAGARAARDEAYWADVEPTAGSYTFPAKVTAYLQGMAADGVDPLLVADYSNPNYDGGTAPYDAAGRTAFANYADALLTHYPQVHELAVWNEWDVNASGPANKTPENYLALLKATYAKVKAGHPATLIVGGSDVDVTQLDWFEAFCAAGGLTYLDVVSIHPYDFLGAPEGLGPAIERVRSLIRQYGNGIDKPIWITEDGRPTGTDPVAVDEATQARYLARLELIALGHGVGRFYVYDFMNDGTDAANREHNYGLVHSAADPLGAYTPKPSYVAYATTARQLAGATFLGDEVPGNGLTDQLFAAADGTPLRAIWSTSGSTTVTITATGPVRVTRLYGAASTLTPDASGHVTITVGVDPTFVSGAAVSSVTAP